MPVDNARIYAALRIPQYWEVTKNDAKTFLPFGFVAGLLAWMVHKLASLNVLQIPSEWAHALVTDHVPLSTILLIYSTAFALSLCAGLCIRPFTVRKYLVETVYRLSDKLYSFVSAASCLLTGFSAVVLLYALGTGEKSSWLTLVLLLFAVGVLLGMPLLLNGFVNAVTSNNSAKGSAVLGILLSVFIVTLAWVAYEKAKVRTIGVSLSSKSFNRLVDLAQAQGVKVEVLASTLLDKSVVASEDLDQHQEELEVTSLRPSSVKLGERIMHAP